MIDDYYVITAEPLELPISLVETKLWLRVDTTTDDILINSLMAAARQFGEKFCNRIFVNTSFDCFFSGLDVSPREPYPFLQIRRAPLVSVTSVEYYSEGVYVPTTDYVLRSSNGFSRLIFQNGLIFDTDTSHPIKVSIVAGYGTAANVPEMIKTALKSHVAFFYENRGDVAAEGKLSMPLETRAIYTGKYRILNTFG